MLIRSFALSSFLLLVQVVAFTSACSAGSMLSRLAGAQPGNLTLEDGSREQFVDVSGDGFLGAGDALVGFAQIERTFNPSTSTTNNLYAVFSQTFDSATFDSATTPFGMTRYWGEFVPTASGSGFGISLDELLPNISAANGGFDSNAMIAIIEAPGAFSLDLLNADIGGGTNGFTDAIGAIQQILDAEGTLAFTMGLGSDDDFFVFETEFLDAATDFVAGGIGLTESITTGSALGNFGAGLSILDNGLAPFATFNRVVTANFTQNRRGPFDPDDPSVIFGSGSLYDASVVNGNFGGISDGAGGLVNNGGVNFINNADLVVNATVVPEPSSVIAWAMFAVLGTTGFVRRRFVFA